MHHAGDRRLRGVNRGGLGLRQIAPMANAAEPKRATGGTVMCGCHWYRMPDGCAAAPSIGSPLNRSQRNDDRVLHVRHVRHICKESRSAATSRSKTTGPITSDVKLQRGRGGVRSGRAEMRGTRVAFRSCMFQGCSRAIGRAIRWMLLQRETFAGDEPQGVQRVSSKCHLAAFETAAK
ncbi:hypothetical protein K458DRAFT_112749 [Lentithecium fluviatile CBS 122367]|uniref:Uncharacterized protein n=1 Tax=Lentithecium fluviatile CBS 122367 TaxID=1168545 RepID=A0A6G1INV0_9PLEO|nr:hypothetical protein K458DRAFT_112749 [Lentithecium fluviatile CBS 122367]